MSDNLQFHAEAFAVASCVNCREYGAIHFWISDHAWLCDTCYRCNRLRFHWRRLLAILRRSPEPRP